ncbi:MAG: F0F1 ATP synthase subunit epsilon [Acidimicrobiales bacterium]|jgi:F-type H+-transporting ATPase subunit epsilon
MADDPLFSMQLVTPERVLIDGVASEVTLRTGEGDTTFLAGHTPLVGTVEPGVVRVVDPDGEVRRVAVHGGFVQVEQHVGDDGAEGGGPTASSGTRVTILAGVAEPAEEIDVERARAARDGAEARVNELAGSGVRTGTGEVDEVDPELADAQAALLRAEVRLEAAEVTTGASAA